MKASSALSARRLATTVVVGLSAVTLLSGCGFGARQQAAAIVNGEVISQAEVQQTAQQLHDAKLDFPENVVVTALIAAPLLQEAVAKSGSWQPDETYANAVAAIPGATDTTKEFISAVALIQSQRMTPADVATYRSELKSADISVNPRYGKVIHSNDGPVYFTVGQTTPNWIAPGTAPTATPTTPAG
ncbi:hypothetical protein N865_09950 [Intrasporangium oryzae NRRL B-24470]|uniref:Lipoprotein n=1 Tax=Intrasporangium oryzae NRRL B-24470 TaxID=1386089 RepID=W9G8M4_9MICO|nr:hypothetical protein [Intrasporangium oryzae]EWT01597.1 hypothetical protein N865_09950 [Intrasporangium oryzae NRRL B-24470]